MDIDDILANLGSSPLIRPETIDLQALTRAWVTERCAPEILPWPESLIERVLDRINAQVPKIFFLSFFRSFVRGVKEVGEREREREVSNVGRGCGCGGEGGGGGRGGGKEKGGRERAKGELNLADFTRGSRLIWWRHKRGIQIPRRIFD